jgi:translation initiation factor IF-3
MDVIPVMDYSDYQERQQKEDADSSKQENTVDPKSIHFLR